MLTNDDTNNADLYSSLLRHEVVFEESGYSRIMSADGLRAAADLIEKSVQEIKHMTAQTTEERIKRAADVLMYRWSEIVSLGHPKLFEEIALEVVQEFSRDA